MTCFASFTCDLCGAIMQENDAWWCLVAIPPGMGPRMRMFHMIPLRESTPLDREYGFHLCDSSACHHTALDRWMASGSIRVPVASQPTERPQ